MKKHYIILILLGSILFSVFNIYTSDFPEVIAYWNEWMLFLAWISLGLISAVIFYFFQTYLPERQKKIIVQNNFLESYKYFKLNAIQTFLWVINEEHEDHAKLLEVKEFRKYFTNRKWEKLVNKIEDEKNSEHFNNLIFEIELLHKKINILLLSINLPNDTLTFLHRLDEALHRLQYIKKDSDRYQNEYKYFWGTLKSVFCAWSFIDWYSDLDYVEKKLEDI